MTRAGYHYLPPLVWTGFILLMSTAGFSGAWTGSVLESICRHFYPGLSDDLLRLINYVIRKSAHLAEYAVLAILWLRALTAAHGMPRVRAAWAALIVCVLVAVADETHQAFVAVRDGSPYDVMLDVIGAAAALSVHKWITGPDPGTPQALF